MAIVRFKSIIGKRPQLAKFKSLPASKYNKTKTAKRKAKKALEPVKPLTRKQRERLGERQRAREFVRELRKIGPAKYRP